SQLLCASMAASSTAVRRVPARDRFWPRLAALALGALVIGLALSLVYAGSPDRLPDGARIAGVDVGGLSAKDAKALLAGRSARLVLSRARRASRARRPAAGHGREPDERPAAGGPDRLRAGAARGRRRDAARAAVAPRDDPRPADTALPRPGRRRVLRAARAPG